MISFSPPRVDEVVVEEVRQALLSGWITTGPRTKLFEKKISEYCEHERTLCVNSASAGLELMLRWFGVGAGDEVIVPAYTYAATANVVVHCGAVPVFVDIQDDFNISVQNIRKAISEKTKVIIPVDIGGYPCDYDAINNLVREEQIKAVFKPESSYQMMLGRILVLSDAAHSIGAKYKGKRTGNLTDVTVFSFHAVKNLTTAEGGAICLNLPLPFKNDDVYQELNIKSLHGQTKDALAKSLIGNWQYDIIEAGFKCNMTDIQAAMGLIELQRYDNDMLVRRREIFNRYSTAFTAFNWAWIPEYENTEKLSSYHLYLLRIKGIDEKKRNIIIQRIFEKQVAVNVHYIPLPMMTYYKNIGHRIENYPSSYQNYSCEISLPVYYTLSDKQIDLVIGAVTASVESVLNQN